LATKSPVGAYIKLNYNIMSKAYQWSPCRRLQHIEVGTYPEEEEEVLGR